MSDYKNQGHCRAKLEASPGPDYFFGFHQEGRAYLVSSVILREYFRNEQFRDQVQKYSDVRMRIKQLFLVYRSHRIAQLNEICDRLGLAEPPAQWEDEVDHVSNILQSVMEAVPTPEYLAEAERRLSEKDVELLDQYCASFERTCLLKSHLGDVEEDLTNFAHILNTQATAELTSFRGFRDWCQVMLQLTGTLSNSLIVVSTLGAGLVYSTVFSATRGDVGLMCYCFPFFSCGFLLPVVIQVLLQMGATLQKEVKFASQQFWTIIIGIFLSITSMAVMASLTILNLMVFFLNKESDQSGIPPGDEPSTPVPGIIAFGITGSIFILVLTGVLLSAIAAKAFTTLRGVRVIVSAMYGSAGGHPDALKLWVLV
ncbi:hypothetical protein BDP27DRAFT_1361951 [Rhodocollybia butyracea]|uniref:Uncharacterized protein n=1 Tax=Rhodocollybia butyracea TaxID=206335 RepID=A0A9P5PZ45_9AGAR|nr:hypothetical protein BDP27DRAFT_1361951 [Rhodocollybia butyracea]